MQTELVELVREAILSAGLVTVPVLAVAFLVGAVVGLVQSATAVHEPVVGFVPRLVATGAMLFLAAPWMVERLVEFFKTAAAP